jgi:hypothetical protein
MLEYSFRLVQIGREDSVKARPTTLVTPLASHTPEAFHSKAWGCRACGYPRFDVALRFRTPKGLHRIDITSV